MNPNRVVIDTNVFISALLNPLGTPKKVINITVSQFTILQSEATYQELATRIGKKKFDKYLEKDDRLDFLSCKDSGVSNAVTERLLKSQNSLN